MIKRKHDGENDSTDAGDENCIGDADGGHWDDDDAGDDEEESDGGDIYEDGDNNRWLLLGLPTCTNKSPWYS